MSIRQASTLAGRGRAVLAVIGLLSGLGLAYEVALTRIFSLIFQYHYVFLIVSVSIAGLSVGAALATLVKRNSEAGAVWTDLTYGAALLALVYAGVTLVLTHLRSANSVGVALAAAVLPFIGIGFLNAALFARFARSGGVLYAADLMGGAGGLVVAPLLVGLVGAFDSLLVFGVLAGVAAAMLAWISCQQALRQRALAALGLLIAALTLNRATGAIAFSPHTLADAPPDKSMLTLLQAPGASLIETRWDSFARVDMVEVGDPLQRYVFTDAGAGSTMIRYDGNDARVDWIRWDIAYLPFALNTQNTEHVLILGAGAGRDVLMAHLAGADSITAVEINPALVAMTRASADYNGGVYDLPGVQTAVTDGRNYIERSETAYDLIYANIVYSQAAAPGNSALAESYVFTREALHTYWSRLTDEGRIGFVTHHAIEGMRLLIAGLDMLQREGMTLQQALRHVALVSAQSADPQNRPSVVLITRQPWDADTARAFVAEMRQRGAGALYLPNFMEIGLQVLTTGARTLDQYIAANIDFNYAPTTDDSPFFHQFAPGLPPGLSDLGLISGLLVFAYFSWLVFFFVRRDRQHWKRVSLSPYFALLGAAYMLVQIPLIQRFGLLLGQPVLSLIIVVGALLVGGGLGSLFSQRFLLEKLPARVPLFALGVGGGVLVSLPVYPALIDAALPLDLPLRAGVAFAALLPLGFLMGVPFPSGLRAAHHADPGGVAAFWGANAMTSVLGSALAMILAVSVGFTAALVAGAALYALTAALVMRTWPRLFS